MGIEYKIMGHSVSHMRPMPWGAPVLANMIASAMSEGGHERSFLSVCNRAIHGAGRARTRLPVVVGSRALAA